MMIVTKERTNIDGLIQRIQYSINILANKDQHEDETIWMHSDRLKVDVEHLINAR